jgi:GntR family transcriptional regulator/MocR family aminotransferase
MHAFRPLRATPLRPGGGALWTTRLDRSLPVTVSRQLAIALRRAIADGDLGAGVRLPSTRALASELGIARSTVVAVFDQLAAEGYIAAAPGSGHYVPLRQSDGYTPALVEVAAMAPRRLSRQAVLLRGADPPRRGPPQPFDLGHAEIDGRLVTTWKRLTSRVLTRRSRLEWGYGDPRGEEALRLAIAEYLAAARGVRCRPEQVVLTAGTQQGLSLTAQILLDPNDTAWVEDPCYRAAVDILQAAEARIVPIAVDANGLDITAAPAGRDPPRLLYATPSRQYPLGMAMPLPRRLALLEWAAHEGVWIIEDDYESEFQQPGQALPALQGLDRAGRVIYLGTFSKLLFPSLRLGYAVLPEDLVGPFAAARHLADRQSSGLVQAIVTEFILDGHFARHLKRMRAHYGERQAFLLRLIEQHLAGLIDVRPVASGMYLTAWLPADRDDRDGAAALGAVGVTVMPLSTFVLTAPRPPGLVLGYAGHSEAAMTRAVERMARVMESSQLV